MCKQEEGGGVDKEVGSVVELGIALDSEVVLAEGVSIGNTLGLAVVFSLEIEVST